MNESEFLALFVHRGDAFAQQQRDGAYFPVRVNGTDVAPKTEHVEEHLAGQASYGSYCIRPTDQTVKFVVFDLDTMDEQAKNWLIHCVEHLLPEGTDKRCVWMEWSGMKGYHVWLWLTPPQRAADVRTWIAAEFMPEWAVLADAKDWPLEVFPKQDFVEQVGYGNLVKWPLGVHAKSGARSEGVPVEGWCESPSVSNVVPLRFPEAYRSAGAEEQRGSPPVAAVRGPGESGGGDTTRMVGGQGNPSTPFPCVDRILSGDIPEGNRNNALFHLALYLFGHGIPADYGLSIVSDANARSDRPLPERELRTLVRSAYAGRRRGASCGQGWLRGFCPGPCRAGNAVSRPPGGELRFVTAGDRISVEVVSVNSSGNRRRVTVSHPDAMNTPTLVSER